MKTVVYCGTRAVYGDMATALKSLLAHTAVDRVYFLIEDERFPEELPDCVTVLDVSGQTFFPPAGPNYRQKWTWMVLMRTALSKILEEDVVLSLDTDTIVQEDISALWDTPMDGAYIAAAKEPNKSGGSFLYCNVGVMLMNLKKLREDGKDDEIIAELNRRHYDFPDQDVFNVLCQGGIRKIKSDYNACPYVEPYETAKILHYAARNDWRGLPPARKYRAMSWEDVEHMRRGVSVMIHACPERMWYVEGFLVPSLEAQGIRDILVRCDTEKKGNLISCMERFAECGERPGGTWHIQDDVVVCRDFAERALEHDDGVVCGFCCARFGPLPDQTGSVPVPFLWWSFQCQRIPNALAAECAEWFFTDAMHRPENRTKVEDKKHDDEFFRVFLKERYPTSRVTNLKPNLVEHIDWLLGGSLVNPHRAGGTARSCYWQDEALVEELARAIRVGSG